MQQTSPKRPYSDVIERLRSVGLRPTRQRMALAKLLFDGHDRHITAEKLHLEAQGAAIPVSLATVYNTLHQFTDAGLLREIAVDSARSYFDTNTADHHHFFFEDSGRLEDIDNAHVNIARLPEPPAGTKIDRVDVVVRVNSDK
ncbi:MAG: iron response transcriptional regulator IrrA [Rhodospirillales bacterium]|jgi:Fur family iron response transcriptional regulator